MRRLNRRKFTPWLVVLFFVIIPLVIANSTLTYTINTIEVNSVSYYLDEYDIVFKIEVQSSLTRLHVNSTLEATDDRISIVENPVLSWKLNNQSLQLTAGSPVVLEFRLFVKETSNIPANYTLDIQTGEEHLVFQITPFNPESADAYQSSGGIGAAGGGWLLEDYEIRDNGISKGEAVPTRCLLINNYFQSIGPVYLNYEFTEVLGHYGIQDTKAYSGNGKNTGYYLPAAELHPPLPPIPGVAVIDVDIPWHIYDGSKHHAFNTGTYDTDKAYAYIPGWGTDTVTVAGEWVYVSFTSSNRAVFVVHLVDSNFKFSFPNYLSWFDHIETQTYDEYLYGPDTTLGDQFSLNFNSLVFDWNPSSTDLYDLYDHEMRPFAKGILGLSNDWKGIHGTHEDNHGFDMLFGNRYVFNTADDKAGCVYPYWNQGLLMRGYYINPNLMRTIDQTLGTMHETLHTFSCDEVPYIRYIMSGFLGDYVMHSQTVGEIDLTTYDGV